MIRPYSTTRRDALAIISGGLSWPLIARAQSSSRIPTIGVLWHAGSPEEEQPFFGALQQGFKDLGYTEGQNIRLEHRFPGEVPERFRGLLAELVALKVDVLVSIAPASIYARDATGTIPHIFVLVPDPVGQKYVDSLARPGKNATGLSILAVGLTQKRFQLLREALPGATSIGVLADPTSLAMHAFVEESKAAAAEVGLSLQAFEAPSVGMLGQAFDAVTRWNTGIADRRLWRLLSAASHYRAIGTFAQRGDIRVGKRDHGA